MNERRKESSSAVKKRDMRDWSEELERLSMPAEKTRMFNKIFLVTKKILMKEDFHLICCLVVYDILMRWEEMNWWNELRDDSVVYDKSEQLKF